jgi:conjugative transposon TraN protein
MNIIKGLKSILFIILSANTEGVIAQMSPMSPMSDSLIIKNELNTPKESTETIIEQIYVNKNVSTHFIMEDAVKYSDISNPSVVGDIPIKNVLRIKPLTDSVGILGYVTIATERQLIQFEMVYTRDIQKACKQYTVKQAQAFQHPDVKLSEKEMRSLSETILKKESKHKRTIEKNKITLMLNNVYVVNDHYFFDITIQNHSNIAFAIDQIRFKIEDEKVSKATNFQQIETTPKYQYNHGTDFTKSYRNVFVFDKFTFPNDKILTIELAEKQVSGRAEVLKIKYKDILTAETL